MPVNDTTANRGYQLPHATNNLDYDVARLRASFSAIDADVAGLLTSVAGKAASSHTHTISNITGLQSALDGKLATNASVSLDFLSDVNTAGAVTNQFLRLFNGQWVPVSLDGSMIETGIVPVARLPAHLATTALNSAYAALVHSHAIADVTGLQNALDAKAPLSLPFSFRNLLVNGDFRIDQANAGAAVTVGPGPTASIYSADMWHGAATGPTSTGVFTLQRQSGGGLTWLRATVTSARASLSNENYYINHPIEGGKAAHLLWGTASAKAAILGFWARSSIAGVHSGSLKNHNGTRTYPFAFTISAANTWEFKTVSVPGETSGAWNTDSSASIQLTFGLGATSKGSAGIWSGSNFDAASGSVNLISTVGATLDIRDVQFEEGTVSLPFERLPFALQLALCQRYFCKSYDLSAVPGASTFVGSVAVDYRAVLSVAARMPLVFPTRMRAPPTVTVYNPQTGTTGEVRSQAGNNFAASLFSIGETGGLLSFNPTASEAAYFHYTASARF